MASVQALCTRKCQLWLINTTIYTMFNKYLSPLFSSELLHSERLTKGVLFLGDRKELTIMGAKIMSQGWVVSGGFCLSWMKKRNCRNFKGSKSQRNIRCLSLPLSLSLSLSVYVCIVSIFRLYLRACCNPFLGGGIR